MRYKKFGNSDLETSAIGFGGWPMGSGHYGSFDEQQVIRAIHRSMDLGVTLFDTAAIYGWGEGEKLLGRAIAGRRDDIVLVSKGGLVWDQPGLDGGIRPRDSSRETLAKGLDESLSRLGTDYLDLLLDSLAGRGASDVRAHGSVRRVPEAGQDQVRRRQQPQPAADGGMP